MSKRSYSGEATYEIEVAGHLDKGWATRFEGLRLETGFAGEDAVTVITGQVPDQAALHGVLARIRDLGLQILHVKRLDDTSGSKGRKSNDDE